MQALTKRAILNMVLTVICAWATVFGATLIESLFVSNDPYSTALLITYIGLGLIDAVVLSVMAIYIARVRRQLVINSKMNATLFAILALSFVVNIFLGSLDAYAMPIILTAMLACGFFDSRVSFVTNSFFIMIIAVSNLAVDYVVGQSVDIALVSVLLAGFLVGTLVTFLMGRDTKRISFVMIGMLMGALSVFILMAFWMFDSSLLQKNIAFAYLAIVVFAPVLLCLIFQPILERIFNVTSNMRLVELTDPRHPLMRRLAREAPGTFNHCLTVSNLVETCASVLGENVYLARAAAYYHDIGKLKNPNMFAENQSGGHNIHDELTPEMSTDIIRKHTNYGESICKENRIPCEIAQIAREHHGTTLIAYFYSKAKELTDGREVDVKDFSYSGPTPSTKIAAIVMICDSCEAAIRAMDKPAAATVDKVVKSIIDSRLSGGQFDDCPITVQDLHVVRKTIVNAVCGLYHERIKYPEAPSV